ncbi:MAG: flagellar biosynthetic protein FliO [Devosiaceae bacterium]|nr:flagellar biosynthetic protein FliO [Devosiaceae bacterium]
MGFLTGLFGGETNIWTILLALIIVIALIFFGVWILKLIFKASVTIAGGRKRRLAMVDSLAIDNKRNIILIRRDNVEHLIMVSNTGELLIEGSIPANSGNSELSVPNSPPIDHKIPSLDAKKPALSAGGLAAGSLAAGGAAAMIANKQNNNAIAKPQNTPAKKISADRLGLSRLLRRKNETSINQTEPAPLPTQSSQPQKNTAAVAPIAAAAAAGESTQTIISAAIKSAPSDAQASKIAPVFANNTITPLRNTGILKPISEMSGVKNSILPDPKDAKNINEIKSSPVEDSPVEDSPLDDSPLEISSIEINAVEDIAGKNDENATEKNGANETKPAHGDELNSAETPNQQSKEAKDPQKTEEVTSNKQDSIKAITPDSAKNEVQQIDAKAMESIEEGTNSGDDGAKSSKEAGDSGSATDPKSKEKTS